MMLDNNGNSNEENFENALLNKSILEIFGDYEYPIPTEKEYQPGYLYMDRHVGTGRYTGLFMVSVEPPIGGNWSREGWVTSKEEEDNLFSKIFE